MIKRRHTRAGVKNHDNDDEIDRNRLGPKTHAHNRRVSRPLTRRLSTLLLLPLAAAIVFSSHLGQWFDGKLKNISGSGDKDDSDIHVLFSLVNSNDKLRRSLGICLASMLHPSSLPDDDENNKSFLNLHFVVDSLDSQQHVKQKLQSLQKHYQTNVVSFVFYNIDDVLTQLRNDDIYPVLDTLRNLFGKKRHYVYFLSTILHRIRPLEKVSRMIMLDLDVMFRDSIRHLWNVFDDFHDANIMGMAPEMQPVYRNVFWQFRRDHPDTLTVGEPGHDFNSGVVLLDLNKMRQSTLYNDYYLNNATLLSTLVNKYSMNRAHLGDQDFYTLLSFEAPTLFYRLGCEWNVQLCTWWLDHGGYDPQLFAQYNDCPSESRIVHGNCDTPIPGSEAYQNIEERYQQKGATMIRTGRVEMGTKVTGSHSSKGTFDQTVIHLATTVCEDPFYLDEAVVMFKSALFMSTTTSRGRFLVLHIFADDVLRPQIQQRFKMGIPDTFQSKYELVIYPARYPVQKEATWKHLFRTCGSLRLFLPYLINATQSVIYVDTDVLFLRPIENLWKQLDSFGPNALASMTSEHEEDWQSWYKRFARHPYVPPRGMNSGVMLMRLDRMRNDDWQRKMELYLSKYRNKITWGDQDLINIYFHFEPEKLHVMPCPWNYRPDHCQYGKNVCVEATTGGIHVLHGNRRAFHNATRYPTFSTMYQLFEFSESRAYLAAQLPLSPVGTVQSRGSGKKDACRNPVAQGLDRQTGMTEG